MTDKISPIKERILQYIEYKGIQKKDFCEKTGISYANMKGRSLFSEMGGAQIAEILYLYDEISAEWLLRGVGPMLLPPSMQVAAEPVVTYNIKCHSCIEKDILIQEKSSRINELKEMIDLFKETALSKRNSA